ncbi:rhomboid family intramembrane serine protease [Pseudidiomarina insulisalsae]|uniref:Peptidase S54 rhomboid domain-containing protein n=1 Tax=Pseudidiomarina insulisalsae TaxID=575789 RepID=A0A432YH27_9GAMM|nr:rhomboid family intramembrane serine protease [Pseudidiomarina insulisalsae]RUO60215.1 hypothetical protein CWI71_07335 [Pseudidiomarina insulisalsae]
MSDRLQVIICSIVLAAVAVWAYYYQFEYAALLEQFDYAPQLLWQEPWRLLTAHFLHLSQSHWLANIAALLLLTVLFAHYFTVRTYLNALVIITLGSSGLLWAVGFEHHFVGLSIVNHGLLVMGLCFEWQQRNSARQRQLLFLITVLLLAKWLAEAAGWWQSMLTAGQVREVWQLHGAGILTGILAWWLHNRRLAKLARLSDD